jgi:hypothetical protein
MPFHGRDVIQAPFRQAAAGFIRVRGLQGVRSSPDPDESPQWAALADEFDGGAAVGPLRALCLSPILQDSMMSA